MNDNQNNINGINPGAANNVPPMDMNGVPQPPMMDNSVPQAPMIDNVVPQMPVVDNSVPQAPMMDNVAPQPPMVDNSVPQAPMMDSMQQMPMVDNSVPQAPMIDNVAPQMPVMDSVPQTPAVDTVPPVPEPNQTPVDSTAPQVVTAIPATETKKSSIPMIIGIVVVLAVICVVVFVVKPFSKDSDGGSSTGKGNCVEKVKSEGYMGFNGQSAIASGDTQYVFDSSTDDDFLTTVMKLDDLVFNICYTDKGASSVNFHVGSTTKTKMVVSYEIYDTVNNKVLNAKNKDSLLQELGYHSYGKHTEEATVVSLDSDSGYGIGYKFYNIEIEFASGRKVEAEYKVTNDQKDNFELLKENEKYTFDFEVTEDTFDPVKYTIIDFK